MDDNLKYVINLIRAIEEGITDTFDEKVFPIAGGIIVLVIIYGGIQYITGGPKGAEDGKKTIIAAVIGLIIIGLAGVIIYTLNKIAHP